jgi:hypothetical protein
MTQNVYASGTTPGEITLKAKIYFNRDEKKMMNMKLYR